jgi:hypothetical protein
MNFSSLALNFWTQKAGKAAVKSGDKLLPTYFRWKCLHPWQVPYGEHERRVGPLNDLPERQGDAPRPVKLEVRRNRHAATRQHPAEQSHKSGSQLDQLQPPVQDEVPRKRLAKGRDPHAEIGHGLGTPLLDRRLALHRPALDLPYPKAEVPRVVAALRDLHLRPGVVQNPGERLEAAHQQVGHGGALRREVQSEVRLGGRADEGLALAVHLFLRLEHVVDAVERRQELLQVAAQTLEGALHAARARRRDQLLPEAVQEVHLVDLCKCNNNKDLINYSLCVTSLLNLISKFDIKETVAGLILV